MVGVTLEEGVTEDEGTGTKVMLPCPITEMICMSRSATQNSLIL